MFGRSMAQTERLKGAHDHPTVGQVFGRLRPGQTPIPTPCLGARPCSACSVLSLDVGRRRISLAGRDPSEFVSLPSRPSNADDSPHLAVLKVIAPAALFRVWWWACPDASGALTPQAEHCRRYDRPAAALHCSWPGSTSTAAPAAAEQLGLSGTQRPSHGGSRAALEQWPGGPQPNRPAGGPELKRIRQSCWILWRLKSGPMRDSGPSGDVPTLLVRDSEGRDLLCFLEQLIPLDGADFVLLTPVDTWSPVSTQGR